METPGASGSGVVEEVVSTVQSLFDSDNKFLRRIAYVESKDGTDKNTYHSGYVGGILWQVDQIGFQSTQDTKSHPGLKQKLNNVSIDWGQVQWSDLRKPLYAGLAARLYLLKIPAPILATLKNQAEYTGSVTTILDQVLQLHKSLLMMCMNWKANCMHDDDYS